MQYDKHMWKMTMWFLIKSQGRKIYRVKLGLRWNPAGSRMSRRSIGNGC